jgi:hypothetical protein
MVLQMQFRFVSEFCYSLLLTLFWPVLKTLHMSAINLYRKNLPDSLVAEIEHIQQEAAKTPAKDKELALHFEAIEMLRAKGFSYRDLAEWFKERGYKVNHVDVWRAHKNGMNKDQLFSVLEHDEEWQEFVRKKQEGNNTCYEDITPEETVTATEDAKTQENDTDKTFKKRKKARITKK